MSTRTEIKVFAVECETRHQLSEKLRAAIQTVYACRSQLEQAKRTGERLAQAGALLHSAREKCLRAQHDYDAHITQHGCMGTTKAVAAGA